MFCFFMWLVGLGFSFYHCRACLLGNQTTNRIFNYARDVPCLDGRTKLMDVYGVEFATAQTGEFRIIRATIVPHWLASFTRLDATWSSARFVMSRF